MTIFKYELKRNVKQVFIWFSLLLVILVVASLEFKVYQGDTEIQEAMATFEPFFKALGMAGIDFTTAIGFVSIFSLYIYLPLTFYSGLLGLSILSKEEHKRTSEFLLTMPVKRQTIMTAKLIVALLCTILLNILVHSATYFTYLRFDNSEAFRTFILNLSIGVLLIQLIFLSLAFVLSILIRNKKQLNGIFIGLVLGTFMLNMVVGYLENPYFIPYLTPFQYFTARKMIDGEFELIYLLLTTLLIVIPIVISYIKYPKKNIHL